MESLSNADVEAALRVMQGKVFAILHIEVPLVYDRWSHGFIEVRSPRLPHHAGMLFGPLDGGARHELESNSELDRWATLFSETYREYQERLKGPRGG